MSKNFYKQVILSQLIISGWILYGFFDYLMDKDQMGFSEFGLFIFFIESSMLISGIGLILAILRLTLFRRSRKQTLSRTFIYVFSGIFNVYLLLIWIVIAILKLIKIEDFLSLGYMFAALIPAFVIMKDFYKLRLPGTTNPLTDPID